MQSGLCRPCQVCTAAIAVRVFDVLYVLPVLRRKIMIEWFKSAPMGSRQQRMLWAARKVARLTRVTEGGAYQMLESALIEAERLPRLNPRDHPT
jgi:hypothetical protein